jgi:N5-(carboxyethyl)ornithine synthase
VTKSMGFVVSSKENERRRALLPPEVAQLRRADRLLFEAGYGEAMGYGDDDYRQGGAHIVTREEAFAQPIVCNPKPLQPDEFGLLKQGQMLFGWIHAVQNRAAVDYLVTGRHSAVAWEDMYDRGRHVFWRNNEIAGEVGVWHALMQWGRTADGRRVAVLGRGNVARGAVRTLDRLGAQVTVFSHEMEPLFRDVFHEFDIVVNAVLWDVFRTDRLLWRDDLPRMRSGSMIIDLSCDEGLEIETSRGTTIEAPLYFEHGVAHYAVDHTPALVWKTASESISSALAPYIDVMIEERATDDPVLGPAIIIRNGVIADERITRFQRR